MVRFSSARAAVATIRGGGIFFTGGIILKTQMNITHKKQRHIDICKYLYGAFMTVSFLPCLGTQAFAATPTIWEKASEIMKDLYSQVVTISTVAAVVTVSIALLLMNFSKSGRTVDESRAWLKRIIITWAIINGLGFIMAYVTPFFTGGTWTP